MLAELVEENAFAFVGAIARGEHLLLVLLELGGDVPLGIFQCLLTREDIRCPLCLGGRQLDVKPEDLVVAHLQRWQVVLIDDVLLVLAQPSASVSLEPACLVELGVDSVVDQPALTQVRRRVFGAAASDLLAQRQDIIANLHERVVVWFKRFTARDRTHEFLDEDACATERHQITRRGSSQRDATRDTRHVAHVPQHPGEIVPQVGAQRQRFDRVQSRVDRVFVDQRGRQPVADESFAHGRVHDAACADRACEEDASE